MSTFHSLTKRSDFSAVYEFHKTKANRLFVMYAKKSDIAEKEGINRVGISVSKKVGNSVVRHRIKRVVREVVRTNSAMFDTGSDIVIIARVEAKNSNYRETEKAVIDLFKKHGLLRD